MDFSLVLILKCVQEVEIEPTDSALVRCVNQAANTDVELHIHASAWVSLQYRTCRYLYDHTLK